MKDQINHSECKRCGNKSGGLAFPSHWIIHKSSGKKITKVCYECGLRTKIRTKYKPNSIFESIFSWCKGSQLKSKEEKIKEIEEQIEMVLRCRMACINVQTRDNNRMEEIEIRSRQQEYILHKMLKDL